jgi:hypothetical protein
MWNARHCRKFEGRKAGIERTRNVKRLTIDSRSGILEKGRYKYLETDEGQEWQTRTCARVRT